MLFKKFEILFRKTPLAKMIFARKRSSVGSKKKSKKSNSIPNIKLLSKFNVRNFNRRQFIVFSTAVSVILLILVSQLGFYFSIRPIKFSDSEESTNLLVINKNRINVLFSVYNEREGYKYLDNLVLFQNDYETETTNVYFIPVTLETNIDGIGIYPIQSIFNSVTNNNLRPRTLMSEVQDLVGIRVDRYMILNRDAFTQMLQKQGVQYPILDDNNLIRYKIESNKIVSFLFDTENEELSNDISFWDYYLSNHFSLISNYKYFLYGDSYTKLFATNLNRNELIRFIGKLKSQRFKYVNVSRSISLTLGKDQIGIDPDTILMDEEVKRNAKFLDIISEQAEVEIYNASEIGGLASKKRRELENLGINVVKFGNFFEPSSDNTLYVINPDDAKRFEATINEIRQSLRDDLVIVYGNYEYNYSGDLVLILAK